MSEESKRPKSLESYRALLNTSGLVDEDQLARLVEEFKESVPPEKLDDGRAFGRFLVEREAITDWQHQNLCKGTGKGYELGKYRLLKPLGVGGMGTVFLGQHKLMKRLVAIKALPKSMVSKRSYLERFHREVQLVASLDHPNIVQAYSADNEEDQHYLVMEYVDGEDLQALVDRSGPLSFADAAHYLAQAADGLAHAHAAKIVHRDIKPANLLVDKQGTIKILDMGLARLGDEDHSITREHDERLIGTTDYMAPEQALDSHAVDARADIYSLGCTLYFALTGHAPFPTGTVAEKLLKHHKEEPESILTERPDCPPVLVEVCRRMMAKQPDDRYQKADEVRAALETIADGGSPVGEAPETFDFSVAEPEAEVAAEPAEPAAERSPRQTALWIATGAAALVVICFISFLMFGNGVQATAKKDPLKPADVTRQANLPQTIPGAVVQPTPPEADPPEPDASGQFAFVNTGTPVAVRELGTPWKRERGFLESTGPRDLMYGTKPVAGEFHIRARLSLQVVDALPADSGPSFLLDDNKLCFANQQNQMLLTWNGQTTPVGNTTDFIQSGVPFEFEARRFAGKVQMRINGRNFWETDDAETAPWTVGFEPSNAVLRLYQWTAVGTVETTPNLPTVPPVTTAAASPPQPTPLAAPADLTSWEQGWKARHRGPPVQFHQLAISQVTSDKGATFDVGPDGIVMVSGKEEDKSDYTIEAYTGIQNITGFRLDALAFDGKGPGRSGNSNFVLNSIQVFASDTPDFTAQQELRIVGAWADHSQTGFAIQQSIDGCLKTGWAILNEEGQDHWAVYTLDKPLPAAGTRYLKFVLAQQFGGKHTIGRFRLSAMTGLPRSAPPENVAKTLAVAAKKRTPEQQSALAAYVASCGMWLGNSPTNPRQDNATKILCVYGSNPVPDAGRLDQFKIDTRANKGSKCTFYLLRPLDNGKLRVVAAHEVVADGKHGSRTIALPEPWDVQRGDLVGHIGRGGPAHQGGYLDKDTWYHPIPEPPVAGKEYALPTDLQKNDRLYGLQYHFVPYVETRFPKQAPPPAPLPFAEFAAAVDLPRVGTAEQPVEGWNKPVELGHAHLGQSATPLDQLTLIGGDQIDDDGKFALIPQSKTPQGQVWLLGYQPKKDPPKPIAQCGFAGGKLYWHWLPGVLEERRAQQIRNCLLKLEAGGQSHVLALRAPITGDALVLDLSKPMIRHVDLDWAPRAALVRMELSFASDTLKPTFKPKPPFEAGQGVINALHGAAPDDQVLAFKIHHRFDRRLTLKLEPYFFALAMGQWTEFTKASINVAIQRNTTAAALAKKLMDEANRLQNPTLKKQAQEAAKAEQAKVDTSVKQVETLNQLLTAIHCRSSLEFRVYCDYGDAQLDLIRSKPAEIPPAEPPAEAP